MQKRFLAPLFGALLTLFSLPQTAIAREVDEEPIITFRTTLYEDSGEGNTFSMRIGSTENDVYVDIDCGFGAEELQVAVAALESSGSMGGTYFKGKVSKEGVVRIYGDPTKIDYLNVSGSSIVDIQFHKDLALQILNLEYNTLKSLNVDHLKDLQVLWLCDNPFTAETPLKIGRLEKLLILDIAQVGYVSPDFDLTNFPALMTFNAYYAKTLKKADTSKCPNLVTLSLEMTAVEEVDVSTNAYLSVLNVADSRVRKFDITKNRRLTELYFGHESGKINTDIKVDEVDLSGNPLLYILYGGGNRLKSIDISKNPKLMALSVPFNYISSIDISNNPDLYTVNLSNNLFSFGTLPADPGVWNEYYYAQRDIELPDYVKVGEVIDLSERVLRAKSVTLGRAYYVEKDEPSKGIELDESYYTYADGKVTFLKPVDKQVYLEYSNSELQEYNLRTEFFNVVSGDEYGKEQKAIEFACSASTGQNMPLGIGVKGASKEAPVTIHVDFGDGELKEFSIDTEWPTSANVVGKRAGYQNMAVYLPMGEYVSSLSVSDVYITNINLSGLTELRNLELVNTGLYSIDLSYNKLLEHLDLSFNNLRTLSLKGPSSYFYKSLLTDLNVSNNMLTGITFDNLEGLQKLDISNNLFEEFDLSDADNLESLKVSNNLFTAISLDHSEQLSYLDISNNDITSLLVPETAPLAYLNVTSNRFTLANLPGGFGLDDEHFIYAPQKTLSIATTSPGINLSSENVTVGGESTRFVWRRLDGGSYTEGVDYTLKDGITKFITLGVGKVYCEISHPAYPAFTGKNVLKTSYVTPIGMPQIELASFTTLYDGDEVTLSLAATKAGTSVYFDWEGDGNVTQYLLGTTYTKFSATTKADTKVRVLVAEASDKFSVFSISGATMSEHDFSPLSDVPAITIADAGLEEVNLPASSKLNELNLSGNKLKSFDLSKFPNLIYVALTGNALKSIDLSVCKDLQLAYLGDNKLTEVKMNNSKLWNLDLSKNSLEEVSLSGCPALTQLWVTSNRLSQLDITPVSKNLSVLNVVGNRFTFASLPRVTRNLSVYSYGLQDALEGKVVDGKVDFSAEAAVGDSLTTFRWFIGNVSVDEDGNFEGEELYIDEEYTLENGVTTFLLTEKYANLVCIMTNGAYPNLVQYTSYVTFDPAANGVQEVRIHTASLSGRSFNLSGQPASSTAEGILLRDGKKGLLK